MLVVPAGTQKSGAVNASINVAYVFARGSWTSPLMQLPVAPKVEPISHEPSNCIQISTPTRTEDSMKGAEVTLP